MKKCDVQTVGSDDGLSMNWNLPYERSALALRAAHLGVGAFHRAHQQVYYDDLARAGLDTKPAWGVVGINLTPPDIAAAHAEQGGCYTVFTEDGDSAVARQIGTLRQVHDADSASDVDWTSIDFATLTITEKGYCHRAGSFELDPEKVASDLASPKTPGTAIGYLAWMLDRRRRYGGRPITLASCDNVPDNGVLLGSILREYVAQAFPDSLAWVDDNVAFPTSMVDRIVPAMSPESYAKLEGVCGYRDALGVVAEPFRQWVIEDCFAAERPEFEQVGVQVVRDLAPYEHMKHRLLNGLQSAYAELGRLCGYDSSHGASSDKGLQCWAEVFLASQAATLTCPEGENLERYGRTSLKRLQNPTIHHPLNQIASDASFKLPQRIAAPAAELLERGWSAETQAMVMAGWALQAGSERPDENGVVTTDPMATQLRSLRQEHEGSPTDLAHAFLALPIWPMRLREDANFTATTAAWIKTFMGASAEERRAQIQTFSRGTANA